MSILRDEPEVPMWEAMFRRRSDVLSSPRTPFRGSDGQLHGGQGIILLRVALISEVEARPNLLQNTEQKSGGEPEQNQPV